MSPERLAVAHALASAISAEVACERVCWDLLAEECALSERGQNTQLVEVRKMVADKRHESAMALREELATLFKDAR
jgi:hypothetical protein